MKTEKRQSTSAAVSRLINEVLTDLASGDLTIEEANSVSVFARMRKAAPTLTERECHDVFDYALGEFKRISPIYDAMMRIEARFTGDRRGADTSEELTRRAAAAGDAEAIALLRRLPDLELRSFGQVKGN
jgi:hypothetical protein